MTTPTLTGGAGFTEFNGSRNTVTREEILLDANLFTIKIPFLAAGSAGASENIGFFPKVRRVIITGVYDGTDAQIADFINEINAWINAGTQTERTYTSRFTGVKADNENANGQYTIKGDKFNYLSESGSPTTIGYSIEMVGE